MNAVISGRAGLALVIDGEELMSLDVDDLETLVPRSQSDLRFLLADAPDLVTLQNTGRDEIAQRLDLEHDIACALDMTLIALAPDTAMELRGEATGALDELLADAHVIERLEFTMYAKPLPAAADLIGALFCTEVKTVAARSFLQRLERNQTAIAAVREAWDALPDQLFGDEPAYKALFHDAACNEGLFRTLAARYGDKASVSAFRIEALKNTSISKLRNYREVLHRWCMSIPRAEGNHGQVIGSENDYYEKSTETGKGLIRLLQHAPDMKTPQGGEPLVTVTMKELLEAGVHFGHQVRRWNPKMKRFIFGERNGIYIIDLQKTQRLFKEAVKFVTQKSRDGASFMFVGTKRQAQDAVEEEAKRSAQFYVNQRWVSGLLTNFQTVRKSIQRMRDIEVMRTDGHFDALTKKERLGLDREHAALEKNLAGMRDMKVLPDVIFIIDANREEIAVHEANKLGITTVAIVDTNCNPDGIDYIVPGNDDAVRSVRLFAAKMADAIIQGQQTVKEGGAEIGEGAEAVAAAGAAETPRDRSDRDDRRGRGRGRRTTYVPPGAPPISEPMHPEATAACEGTPAESEHQPSEGEESRKAETAEAPE